MDALSGLCTRAAPFAGRTDAPSGQTSAAGPKREETFAPMAQPFANGTAGRIRAEGPVVHSAKGAALVKRPRPIPQFQARRAGRSPCKGNALAQRLAARIMLYWVIAYIDGQAEHHRKLTYQEEFRIICVKHGIEIDERYARD
jgi:hypothetical protein